MNRIYKTIWNHASGTATAVSELTAACGKRSSGRSGSLKNRAPRFCLGALSAALLLAATPAVAATVENGTGQNSVIVKGATVGTTTADGQDATAIGTGAKADAQSAISIGSNAVSKKQNAITIGTSAETKEGNSVALGNGAKSEGGSDIAIGDGANAKGGQNVATGKQAKATGGAASAYGNEANAGGFKSTAVGFQAAAASNSATALGNGAKALNNNDVAIGVGAGTNLKDQGASAGGSGIAYSITGNQFTTNNAANIATHTNVSIGSNAAQNGTGVRNIAIGQNAGTSHFGEDSVTLGTNANNFKKNGAADGSKTDNVTRARRTVAIGSDAMTYGEGSIAIGNGAKTSNFKYNGSNYTTAERAIALGNNANASGTDSAAIGTQAAAQRNQSIAFGKGARVLANPATNSAVAQMNNMAIGTDALVDQHVGINSMAIGFQAAAKGSGNNKMAIGTQAVSSGTISSAVGIKAQAHGDTTSAYGSYTQVLGGFDSMAAGSNSSVVRGDSATVASSQAAIGAGAISAGKGAAAIGSGSMVFGANSTSISANGGGAANRMVQALVNGSMTDTNFSIIGGANNQSIGNRNLVGSTSNNNMLFGNDIKVGASAANVTKEEVTITTADGDVKYTNYKPTFTNTQAIDSAVAIGNQAKVGQSHAVAIGREANAAGNNTIAIGREAIAQKDNTIAIGKNAKAGTTSPTSSTDTGAIAIGAESVAYEQNTTAVGNSAKATADSATALGRGSNADSAFATAVGLDAHANGGSAVAVGSGAATSANSATAVGNDAKASASSASAYGHNAKADNEHSVAVGSAAHAQANGAVALGNNAQATHEGAVALGRDSVSSATFGTVNSATVNGITYSGFAGATATATVSVGKAGSERAITNVAAGRISATSTDAINGSQLYLTQEKIGNIGNSVTNILGGNAAMDADGNLTMTNIGGTGKNTIHEAIQAANNNANAANAGFKIAANGDASGITADNKTIKPDETLTIKGTGTGTFSDYDSGNIQTQVSADGTVTVGLKKDLTVNSVTAGDSKLDTNGLTITGGPSVTKAGIDAGSKKITNVADGTIGAGSKDAINGGQLHTALNNINSNIAAAKTEVKSSDGSVSVTPGTNAAGATVYDLAVKTDGTTITKAADGSLKANTTTLAPATNGSIAAPAATDAGKLVTAGDIARAINGSGFTLTTSASAGGAVSGTSNELVNPGKTVTIDAGKNISITQSGGKVSIATKDQVEFSQVTVKDAAGNSTVTKGNGVTITPANGSNAVSLTDKGLNNGGNKITNVAAGTDADDAVNVSQLQALENRLGNLNQANNQYIQQLDDKIGKVGDKANAGVAGAIAQGSIPQVTRPSAFGLGVGTGYYGGQSAIAVGASAMTDGGNWIFKGNFSVNTKGRVGAGAGALYQW